MSKLREQFKEIIKVRTAKNKVVRFTEADIEVLHMLYNFNYLRTQQLAEYYRAILNVKRRASEKRIRRYSDLLLINDFDYRFGQKGFFYKYFKLTIKGIRILTKVGRITEQEGAAYLNSIVQRKPSRQIDHYFATRDIAMRLISQLHTSYEKNEFLKQNKITSPEITLNGLELYCEEKDKVFYHVPDTTLCYKDFNIHLEIDGLTENLKILKEKIDMYTLLARSTPNQRHMVFFIVIDDTLITRNNYPSRSRRVANIRKSFLLNNQILLSNLEVYVFSYSRNLEIIGDIVKQRMNNLKEKRNLDIIKRSLYALKKQGVLSKDYFKSNEKRGYIDSFKVIDINKSRRKDIITNNEYIIIRTETNEHVLIFPLIEGEVASLDTLQYFYDNRHELPVKNIKHIIVLYHNRKALLEDRLGVLYKDVYFTALDMLEDESLSTTRFLKQYNQYGW